MEDKIKGRKEEMVKIQKYKKKRKGIRKGRKWNKRGRIRKLLLRR